MNRSDKIFLIGFMGSGKSTTGKELALRLNWSFIDLDEMIEQYAGMKIRDIFQHKGEPWFREIEKQELLGLSDVSKAVVSTGGGTPCFGDNMSFMISKGITIYLRMTPEMLENRLLYASYERPLLKDIAKEDLREYIVRKLEEREKWYLKAGMVIDECNTDIETMYSLIRKLVRE